MLVDLDGEEASRAALAQAIALGEPQVAIRGGRLLLPRLARVAPPPDGARRGEEQRAGAPPAPGEGVALITGGTGGLGAQVAKHLAAGGEAGELVLVSRRGRAAEGAGELEHELAQLGVRVRIEACDVSDRAALERLLATVEGRLRIVVHAAGVLDDGVVQSLTPDRVAAVLAPKVAGAWHLHELTRELGVSQLVLFSTTASVVGGAGQGAYAAGNAFLDALASLRHAQGLPGVSVAWGLWAGEGMGGRLQAAQRARLARAGVLAFEEDEGLALLDAARASGRALLVGAKLDRGALAAAARRGEVSGLLGDLAGVRRAAHRRASASFAKQLARAGEQERGELTLELVRTHAARVLGHSSNDAVPAERAFKELGFDSLAAVELRNRLEAALGVRLPATLVFDHPSPAALANHLLHELLGTAAPSGARARRAAADEPIAILGIGCRYPGGVGTAEELWSLLAAGADAIGEFPANRGWDLERLYDPDPESRGTSYARHGGFLAEPGEFDAAFFGINRREALAMDPQQRLLLEVCWEALEDAGIDPLGLRGTDAGVFAGVMGHDYAYGLRGSALAELEGYLGTGNAGGVVSGRVAYTLGLEGPAISLDTACSSSLVALHLACQALRAGECSLALAGGVTVLWTPGVFVDFSRQRVLAPDGRCKSYAAAADGTGWGEGVGVLVLERLSEARRHEHPVLAVVRGSAVNQDGASNGLTAPNGPSQRRVIEQALANARLESWQVDAVEGHGTGTALGDPIEAQALLATYGQGRPPERPLWLGSVKSNIGHTQAAAGVAGVIKMTMALRNERLPRTLHVDRPSEAVDWGAGAVALLGEEVAWARRAEPRRAGVSSFGISGTNAHVIVEEAPTERASTGDASTGGAPSTALAAQPYGSGAALAGAIPWVVSGRGTRSLRAQAARMRDHLTSAQHAATDASSARQEGRALLGRAGLEHRGVVVGGDRRELLDGLDALARGAPAPGVFEGVADPAGRVVFVFPGQGSQWKGMAVELLDASPVFAAAMRECEEALAEFVGWSLTGALRGAQGAPSLERIEVVQPALFAVMVSLARLWGAFGVRPAAVVGHSQGEIAAAHLVGSLSLRDAARVVALRSQILAEMVGQGGIVSVALPEEQVRERLRRFDGRLVVAAVNSPCAVVVAGDRAGLDEFLAECAAAELRAHEIASSVPSHAPYVDAFHDRVLEVLAPVAPHAGEIPFYSTVTGAPFDTTGLDASYWYRNLREPVHFEQVIRALLADGRRMFIEISPHPVLSMAVRETAERVLAEDAHGGGETEGPATGRFATISSLRRGEGGVHRFACSLAQAWVRGVDVELGALLADAPGGRVALPPYAFQRERYWLQPPTGSGDPAAAGQQRLAHPLLGAMVTLADGHGWLFTGGLSLRTHGWLADHALRGVALLPGTAFVELALHTGRYAECEVLRELTLQAPLALRDGEEVQLQLTLGAEADGEHSLAIHSRVAEEETWTCNAVGRLARAAGDHAAACAELAGAWPPDGAATVDVEELYGALGVAGFEYGPAFRGLRGVWRRGGEVFAEVSLQEELRASGDSFELHPALLDAGLHAWAASGTAAGGASGGQPSLPFAWSEVRLYAAGSSTLRLRLAPTAAGGLSLQAVDPSGAAVLAASSLALRPLAGEQLAALRSDATRQLLGVAWATPMGGAEPVADDRAIVLGAPDGELARALRASGHACETYTDLAALSDALERRAGTPGIVLLDIVEAEPAFAPGGADGGTPQAEQHTDGAMTDAVRRWARGALTALQAWLAEERLARCELVL
ncbi:MAG TPA: SDR family NAD(P)-dependent oxidoreductase, partial [Solirubrobacteraceae bacterium]|nr:SDR family NAD(P)-dependent oxidoreductase [Solirubrobacteraceae bacterium]